MKVITLRIEDELEIEIDKIVKNYNESTVNKGMVMMIKNHMMVTRNLADARRRIDKLTDTFDRIKSLNEEIEERKRWLQELILIN